MNLSLINWEYFWNIKDHCVGQKRKLVRGQQETESQLVHHNNLVFPNILGESFWSYSMEGGDNHKWLKNCNEEHCKYLHWITVLVQEISFEQQSELNPYVSLTCFSYYRETAAKFWLNHLHLIFIHVNIMSLLHPASICKIIYGNILMQTSARQTCHLTKLVSWVAKVGNFEPKLSKILPCLFRGTTVNQITLW